MKFTRLHSFLIIALVLLSLVGLSAIQLSWLQGARVIQEKKIQEKLERTIDKIKQALNSDLSKTIRKKSSNERESHQRFVATAQTVIDSILHIENLDMEYGFEASGCNSNNYTWYSQPDLKFEKDKACEIHLDNCNFISAAGTKEHLHLYAFVPEKERLIFREMSLAIGSSILFILLLIGAFAYLLWTIFRQKKLSEMKNDFINNLTHEFKTPIASISLAARTLKRLRAVHQSEKAMNYVQLIDQEGKRLENHIDKVLQMATIDSGNLALDKQEVNMHEIIQKVTESLSLILEKRGGEINLRLKAFQPTLWADAMHLFNMLYNLVDNAIKYNNGQPLIRIDSQDIGQYLQISISDNGIGMTNEIQKQVFDRFFRQTTGDVHDVKGFGLGLAYVKRMVDAHNGTIELQSQPGKGTTFSLIFPKA